MFALEIIPNTFEPELISKGYDIAAKVSGATKSLDLDVFILERPNPFFNKQLPLSR